jgi:glucose-1-phosphate thymidylyltransferase
VRIIEERQGARVGCVEEVAWRNGWMSDQALQESASKMMSSGYGEYLSSLLRK